MWPLGKARDQKRRGTGRRRPASRWRRATYFAGGVGLAGAALIATGNWMWQAGHVGRAQASIDAWLGDVAAAAGLTVREVYVTGRVNTTTRELLQALAVDRGDPILAFDPEQARKRLLRLDWIKSAKVSRRLPDLIDVRLQERVPLALWQRGKRFVLVDREGEPITGDDVGRFRDLPIVVGKDAPQHAADIIELLAADGALFQQVHALVRVGGRRWDVQLDTGIEINLPETDAGKAWSQLSELQAEQGIFDRDIAIIDLRRPGHLVVRLTPEAAARRRDPGENT